MADKSPKLSDAECQRIYDEANAAGVAAATAVVPPVMIVGSPTTPLGNDIDPNKKVYVVPDGPCGFAWITIKPANSRFANWAKKKGLARPAYRGGVDISIMQYNQSITRKESHAYAMATHLRNNGINCYADSRMD